MSEPPKETGIREGSELNRILQEIRKTGGLDSASRHYSLDDIRNRIDKFMKGEVPIVNIPRGTDELPLRSSLFREILDWHRETIVKNIETIKSKQYTKVMTEESFGGNAGMWKWPEAGINKWAGCAAGNVYYDNDGNILGVGNDQEDYGKELHEKINKKEVRRGSLIHFLPTIDNQQTALGFQVIRIHHDEPRDGFFPEIVLEESVNRYNRSEAAKNNTPAISVINKVGEWSYDRKT